MGERSVLRGGWYRRELSGVERHVGRRGLDCCPGGMERAKGGAEGFSGGREVPEGGSGGREGERVGWGGGQGGGLGGE